MKDPLLPLTTLARVEPSPFLLTRIKSRIKSLEEMNVSAAMRWSVSLAFLLLIVLDFSALTRLSIAPGSAANLTEVFHLETHNNLYDADRGVDHE